MLANIENLTSNYFENNVSFGDLLTYKVKSAKPDDMHFTLDYLTPYFKLESDVLPRKSFVLISLGSDEHSQFRTRMCQGSYRNVRVHYDNVAKEFYDGYPTRILLLENGNHILIDTRNTTYVFPNPLANDAKYVFMRVLRATAQKDIETMGFVQAHAASVAINGKAILLVGAGGAGKTTMMLTAVLGGAGFISNDKTFLFPAGNSKGIVAYGWPYSINIDLGTTALLPQIQPLFNHMDHYQHYEWDSYKRGKRTFTPIELRRVLGKDITSKAPLAAIIYIDPTYRKEEVLRIEADAGIAWFRDNVRTYEFTDWVSGTVDEFDGVGDTVIPKLLAKAPFFKAGRFQSSQKPIAMLEDLERRL